MSLTPVTRRASGRVRLSPPDGRALTLPEPAPAPRSLAMLPNSLALIATKVATLGLGFLFWLVAARLFPPDEVGLAGGVVAAALLCVQLALLGVGSAVIAMFPRYREGPGRLIDTALTTSILSGAVVGLGFAALAAGAFPELGVVGTRPAYLALFVVMSALGTAGVVLDQLSTTLRRGDQALWRGVLNGALSLAAVAALAAISGTGSMALFACWVLGAAAACVLGGAQLRRAVGRYSYRPRLERPLARRLVVVGLPNHALTLADRAPGLLMPVLVTELLSPTANAYWYVVWMMAWVVFVIPVQVGMTLFAEAAHRPDAVDGLVRHAVRWSLSLGVAAAVALAALGGLVLSLLGARYASAGLGPLRVLVWGIVPMAFVQAYYARCRAAMRLREAVATAVVGGTLTVAAASVAGVSSGLTAMAAAWVGVQGLVGCWAVLRLRALSRPADARATMLERAVAELDGVAVAPPRSGALAARVRALGAREETAPVLAVIASLALWAVSLRSIDLRAMTSLGLVSVLPASAFVAVALLAASFCLTLWRRPASGVVLGAHVAALIFMLYALPALIEPTARFAVTWRHAGVLQAILDNGHVDVGTNPYFDWPGFFVLAGFALRAAGMKDVLGVANWAPLAFQLLYLGPLLLILRTLTIDRRLVWLAVWVFYLTNWVGQDYFSPQAFAYLLYLVVLAILVTWMRPGWPGSRTRPPVHAALVGVVLLLFAVMVVSHQLTPFALLASTTVLVITRRCTARGLPVAMGVILLAWLSYMTAGFLGEHTGAIFGAIGHVDATVNENVSGRLHGDTGHLVVTQARAAMTIGLWGAALAAAVWLRRKGHREPAPLLLFLAPFGLAAIQPYGGEILLRVFIFTLPFTAFFVAAAVRRAPVGVAVAVSLALLGGFLVTRYGNERMDWFSHDEVAAVDRLDAVAPPGSTIVAWSNSLPWQARHYAEHRYRSVVDSADWARMSQMAPGAPAQLAAVAAYMRLQKGGAYLVLTRSQEAEVELTGLGPPGSLARVDAALRRSSAFRLLYANHDASVYALVRARRAP